MNIQELRPAVVIADSGVCEGIFTSYEAALVWATQHGMGVSNVRGGVPFIDVQWPQYGVGLSRETIDALGELEKMRQIERGITEATLDIQAFPMRRREIVIFTPDEIQAAMDKNLASGLRQLAEAIEAGTIDGRCIDCQGNGFTGPKVDARAHLMLRIDLAAPILQTMNLGGYGIHTVKDAPPEGESREEFERDRMGQTGYDNARKMFGEKEKIMSADAIKVNELLNEAADFCRQKADEIRDFVNQEVRTSELLMAAEGAADDLKKIVDDICDLTLDEQEC